MKTRTFQFAEYGPPTDVLELTEQELPEPGPGQALVKNELGSNRGFSLTVLKRARPCYSENYGPIPLINKKAKNENPHVPVRRIRPAHRRP